jgi:hypothetical protein
LEIVKYRDIISDDGNVEIKYLTGKCEDWIGPYSREL